MKTVSPVKVVELKILRHIQMHTSKSQVSELVIK